ncbi:MAG TPA: prepilin-type N-terminal cleavage/methylation domain-containing protein [Baekduia sp.]
MTARGQALRDEQHGFSLVELLAAMAIGSLVLTVLMTIFITGVQGTSRIQDRVDSAQRARVALDSITTLLDSQVCVPRVSGTSTNILSDAPVIAGSDGSSVTFYGDLSGAGTQPMKYTIAYSPTAKTLTKYTYAATGNTPTRSFLATKTAVLIVSDVMPTSVNGVVQPIFTYYTYLSGTAAQNGQISPAPSPVPLTPDASPQVVRVGVQFQAYSSTGHVDNKQHAVVSGSATAATFTPDPAAPSVCPPS